MTVPRDLRVRVLDALERAVKQFRTREAIYPLRVPRDPVSFDELLAWARGDDHRSFDPIALRSRTLLYLQWEDGSTWELWVIVLPSGLKLFCDSGEEESRILASGGRNLGDESDRLFLERLSESGGDDFGIEMSGGAPSLVRSSITDRPFLVDVFVNLFEGTEAETTLGPDDTADKLPLTPTPDGRDFRTEVAAWVERVLR